MIVCLHCKGKGAIEKHLNESGLDLVIESTPCSNCDGIGYLPDPDLVRIAEALERLAVLLENGLPTPVHGHMSSQIA